MCFCCSKNSLLSTSTILLISCYLQKKSRTFDNGYKKQISCFLDLRMWAFLFCFFLCFFVDDLSLPDLQQYCGRYCKLNSPMKSGGHKVIIYLERNSPIFRLHKIQKLPKRISQTTFKCMLAKGKHYQLFQTCP